MHIHDLYAYAYVSIYVCIHRVMHIYIYIHKLILDTYWYAFISCCAVSETNLRSVLGLRELESRPAKYPVSYTPKGPILRADSQ